MIMNDEELISWVRKSMQPIGPISTRPTMEGQAIYLDGMLFAYVAESKLWFRTDDESDLAWDAAGSEWLRRPKKDGTLGYEPYRSAPEGAYTDEKDLRKWAKQGLAAGRRAKQN
ncbi:TfoX/Sxy family protein [Chitinophaga flava]|uniref:Competence protein TfoX n=1 Tax=Chitinophaga flava TaxID=2259036 RepID=A0A365XR01_9BACT|nr:TfoX/Sxy family protein [Chitinophaga flava]RBL88558.1 competence protein TfoX [Chitinophaga flava]